MSYDNFSETTSTLLFPSYQIQYDLIISWTTRFCGLCLFAIFFYLILINKSVKISDLFLALSNIWNNKFASLKLYIFRLLIHAEWNLLIVEDVRRLIVLWWRDISLAIITNLIFKFYIINRRLLLLLFIENYLALYEWISH